MSFCTRKAPSVVMLLGLAEPGAIQPVVNPLGLVSRALNTALGACQPWMSSISGTIPLGVYAGTLKSMVPV